MSDPNRNDGLPELTPPETLTPPTPTPAVTPQQSGEMVKITPDQASKLDQQARQFIDAVLTLDVQSEGFKSKIDSIHNLGNAEMRAAAGVSNRLLEKPMTATKNGLYDDKSGIAKGLLELRKTVEGLDPSRQGDMFGGRRLFGLLPMPAKVHDYFLKYQSAQGHLNAILTTLMKSQDELRKDNASIEQEKVNLWETMQKLRQYVYVGRRLDEALAEKVYELEQRDPEKARIVKEEMLFYTRQKVTDLLTQLAVCVQGYLALDLVRKNNLELIKGVDRATTTTMSALRTAVLVSQALANQKLVLDQITALNTTTGNLIESTSVMLRQQSQAIHEGAASATVSLDKLKAAFDNVYAALDTISDYKSQALSNMQKTVDVLSTQVDSAQKYLDRARGETLREATADLRLYDKDEIKL
ncbi:toxic anion resistance protein [Deinococcus yavapaiensis]|uniref:Uncharacterized protein YaaN involved in tellurite resistance n=1 Tax=Deinococcus yavapaiensis KR-236 TaxID=694435 RepID=A0A318SBV7_9DEIO|nr:toxic anion resistance protein [Deinococcus yavapaiensis]PYE55854.1 uncharacterized protein YaaN involved in tellurite resistance [Deinococcus yavapaiensis KR-236]